MELFFPVPQYGTEDDENDYDFDDVAEVEEDDASDDQSRHYQDAPEP